MNKIIIYSIVCIIIVASFEIPEVLFKIENKNIKQKVYKKENLQSTIDVETEKIYLVKAIHDIENETSTVAILANEKISVVNANEEILKSENKDMKEIERELLKLKEYNILNIEINKDVKNSIGIIDKSYQNDSSNYIVSSIILEQNDKKYRLEIENKTGKILYIAFEKEAIYNKEEIMRNYIKYLDLYIIDDWKFENNMLKSEKAKLIVNLIETRENYILLIHSTGKIFDIYEYDNFVYTIDTN